MKSRNGATRMKKAVKLKNEPTNVLPHVSFLRTKYFEHIDSRRSIAGIAGDLGIPLQIRQIKIIEFTEEAIERRLVVGNHRHFGESGQWEMIIVLGGGRNPLFRFRYRNYKGKVQEKLLKGGDVALVPPGCSLALMALKSGSRLIEISNQEYSDMNYMDDKLF
jgi:hypothetical protein